MSWDVLDEADLRTLSLARPGLTPEALERYLAYQQTLLELSRAEPTLARDQAHERALERSRLDAREHGALAALCRDFAGRQSTVRRLRTRLEEARARGDAATAQGLAPEIDRLSAAREFAARHGEETLRLLREREETLVALHEDLRPWELRPAPSHG